MKKYIWIALIVFSCAEKKETPIQGSQIPAGAIVQDYEDIPGLQKISVKSGSITTYEGDFLNGLHHGTWTFYDDNGKIARVTSYLNGKKQGPQIFFETSGGIKRKLYHHNDVLNGESLEYKRNSIVSRTHYVNGEIHGSVEKFYPDGTLMESSNYVDGVIDGKALWYNQEGEVIIEYTYDMGERLEE